MSMLSCCLLLIAYLVGAMARGGPEHWRRLNSLQLDSDYRGVAEYAETIAAKLTPQAAALLLENAAANWPSPRYVGQLASAWSFLIAENKSLFLKTAKQLYSAFPEAPVSHLLGRFAKGHESLLDDPDWIKQYLKAMGGKAKVKRCGPSETRECGGDFQRNLLWVMKSFPETSVDIAEFLVQWSDGIFDEAETGHLLKYAYIRYFPVVLLLQKPSDLSDLIADSQVSENMALRYGEVDLQDRLEVMEYILWSLQIGDNLADMTKDLQKTLKWILNNMVVIDRKQCRQVVEQLASTDAYRTLSLIWQLKVCPNKVTEQSTFKALESNAPLSFAVYLQHGLAVKRDELRRHRLTKMYVLMLDIRARKRFGQQQWQPCQSKAQSSRALTAYKWTPPVGIEDLSAPSVVLIARYLLYHQFGVPFDNTKTTAESGDETLEWSELPGLATTLLERHCQLLKKHPIYKIVIKGLPTDDNSMVEWTKEDYGDSSNSSSSLSFSSSSSSSSLTDSDTVDFRPRRPQQQRPRPRTPSPSIDTTSSQSQSLSSSSSSESGERRRRNNNDDISDQSSIISSDDVDTFGDRFWTAPDASFKHHHLPKGNTFVQVRRKFEDSEADSDDEDSDDDNEDNDINDEESDDGQSNQSDDSFSDNADTSEQDNTESDDDSEDDEEKVKIIHRHGRSSSKSSHSRHAIAKADSVVEKMKRLRIRRVLEQMLLSRQQEPAAAATLQQTVEKAPEDEAIIDIDEEDVKRLNPDAVIIE